MKKNLLLFCLIGFISKGQTPYYKMVGTNNSEWYIFQALIPVSNSNKTAEANSIATVPINSGKYSATKDTFVMGKNYKKFYHNYVMPSFPSPNFFGYIREDSAARQVYFLDKTATSEDLLYDFSLSVGDSVFYNFPNTSGNFPKGYYKVKIIQNVSTNVGVRKKFKLLLNPGTSDTLNYIESIGSDILPVYLYSSFYPMGGWFGMGSGSCKFPYVYGLACKYSDNLKFFQSCTYTVALSIGCIFKYDSCNYYNTCSGIKENNLVNNFNLYPNPAKNSTNINFFLNEDTKVFIEVIDVTGRHVKTVYNDKLNSGENNLNFSVEDIAPGSYFINLNVKGRDLKTPFVVIH